MVHVLPRKDLLWEQDSHKILSDPQRDFFTYIDTVTMTRFETKVPYGMDG